jgi:hypothetical protein
MGKTYKDQKNFDRFSYAQSIGRAQRGGVEGTKSGKNGYKRKFKNERAAQEQYA